jgi:hypothetical protein
MIMRLLSCLLAVSLLAGPGFAQELGERTQSPEALLAELGLAPGQDDLAEAIAAAEAHPLGTRENPVRVGGPTGERSYIARLRCADGAMPRVGQRGSAGVGAFGTIVYVYPLDCGDAAPGRVELVMDMYHSEHAEDRPPPGFTIVSR